MELKEQKFGIEIEMTGITRAKAAEVTAEYFGTRVKYLGTYYDTYAAIDTEGRQWKFMSDGSITAQKKSNGRKINAGREYQTEMVSPICRYEDIVTIQEIIRKLKEHGALTNGSCGIHVHINAEPFDARTLRNITNIMAAKEDLIYKALGVSVDRQHRWCQPVDTRFLEELNRRKPKSMEAVERIWYNGESRRDQHYDDSRYHCLNLHSVFQKGTVEFRLFNGTLHAGKIKAYIQFCNVPYMDHIWKPEFGYPHGKRFYLTGPYRYTSTVNCRQRESSNPVKQTPQCHHPPISIPFCIGTSHSSHPISCSLTRLSGI